MAARGPVLAVALTAALVVLPAIGGADTRPAPGVPVSVLDTIKALFNDPLPRGISRDKAIQLFTARMKKVLDTGVKAEKDHPNASDLHEVRVAMLQAADLCATFLKGESFAERRTQIAARLLKSDAPPKAKVLADGFVVRDRIATGKLTPAQQRKELLSLAKRYRKTPVEAEALLAAASLAADGLLFKTLDELTAKLRTSHADRRDVGAFLQQVKPIGKPFQAVLTDLDGKKLSLPKDLKDKVLVIDFWATWCGPCIVELPNMRKAYAAYKSKGVEFVGISVDRPDSLGKLKAFVAEKKLNWVHTYSGKYWNDPAVVRYKIRGIPSIWVLARGGRIVSTDARGRLAEVLDKALALPPAGKTPTTRPAADPAPAAAKKN